MNEMAGATTLGDLASAIGARAEEASVVAELKAGSEEAYAWLIAQYHQPIYNVVYRILSDPADAADTTQEVFIKVFRGMKRFNGKSSLKTWIYRIAVHEASNHRRWWFRHKAKETSMEASPEDCETSGNNQGWGLKDTLVDEGGSPFDSIAQNEVKVRVEKELKEVQEPYRTTVILRDIEELSYEEIAEVMETSLGTVKSRLMRGRDALKKRLACLAQQSVRQSPSTPSGRELEVTP
jgi:RNA polymerase sigma-70 factor (ECF subfamily)